MEILAPAGGMEQLIAGVRSGADAVYLGAGGFNARQNAENFDSQTLNRAVAYCHERGVKAHITLNTLVMDDELAALTATLDEIVASGADAVIVQDPAVAMLVRSRYPDLPMHASTQMTIHNAAGAQALMGLGFSQAVLARELSIEEIAAIHKAAPIPLEVFVHGALCVCVSGQCYLSSILGGRSGNRGLCAQPCRTNMTLKGRPYALSLKDMTGLAHMEELARAGVATLKIEGRMKRPEYVAAAVTACRNALSGQRVDMDTLQAVFSRSGFTDGYLTGKRNREMFGYRTKEDVTAAGKVLSTIAASYAAEPGRIPVEMSLVIAPEEPVRLTVTDGTNVVHAADAPAELAKTAPLTSEEAERHLSQTGGTPYYVKGLKTEISPGLRVSVSRLKQLRRDALTALSEERSRPRPFCCTGAAFIAPKTHEAPEKPAIRLSFEGEEQIFDAPQAQTVLLPMALLLRKPALIDRFGEKLICRLPELCFPDREEEIKIQLKALRDMGVSRVTAGNLGMAALGKEAGFLLHGDYGLNVLNSVSLEAYEKWGFEDALVSFELPMKRIVRLGGALKRGVIAYGYLPLMKMRICPAQGTQGCGGCGGVNLITDARNQSFTLLCRDRRYVELLNGTPLYLGDKPLKGLDFVLLRFTTESAERARAVYEGFLNGEPPAFQRTCGLYYRTLQ